MSDAVLGCNEIERLPHHAMVFVYIVRCKFTAPDKEAAWNTWYGGPKIVQMLAQPYFRSCQRFRRTSGTGRDYLALWTVQSPEALKTPQYTAQWGFAEWSPYITDWSRDLFDGGARSETDFAVPTGNMLHVVSFDGGAAADADMARAAQPNMMWLPVIGLDRHTPMIGLRRFSEGAPDSPAPGSSAAEHTIYRPISDFHVSAQS